MKFFGRANSSSKRNQSSLWDTYGESLWPQRSCLGVVLSLRNCPDRFAVLALRQVTQGVHYPGVRVSRCGAGCKAPLCDSVAYLLYGVGDRHHR